MGNKILLSEFLRKWGWFYRYNKLLKFKISKNWDSLVDEKAMITMTLISSCHWKIPAPFSFQKKRPENAFLTLTVNYRTEKQIMLFKTTVNWLLNDIWSYLAISCFDWKICVYQQTVVRGLLSL